MEEETFIQKRITNQDVYDELMGQREIQNQILTQAKKTNGRVTELEARSIGVWIKVHPIKFAMFVVIFMGIVISDIRHPLIALITNLI